LVAGFVDVAVHDIRAAAADASLAAEELRAVVEGAPTHLLNKPFSADDLAAKLAAALTS
jgi:hypothetical protein